MANPQDPPAQRKLTESKPRVQQLDFLRGIAILLVLLRHPIVEPHDAGKLLPIAGLVHHLGWTGVDLFFVLSGFLVGGLLFDELRKRSTLGIKRFIIRRGFKIWPPYFVYLLFVYVVLVVVDTRLDFRAAGVGILPNLLHVQNYLGSVRGHTWSLAVEEHFYLVLPFLVAWLLPRDETRAIKIPALPYVAVALSVFCLGFRLFVNLGRPFETTTHYFATHVRVDSLFFGVLLAYLYHYKFLSLEWVARYRMRFTWVGLLLISPMAILGLHQPFVWTVGYTLLYLGYGALLLALLSTTVATSRVSTFTHGTKLFQVVCNIGYFSYSIYLWHMDISPAFCHWLLPRLVPASLGTEIRYVVGVLLYVPLAILQGIAMAKLIEGPSLALRDRLFPSRSRGFTPANSAGSASSAPAVDVVRSE